MADSDNTRSKKSLNVDSPSFTPAGIGSKKPTFSSQAASAPAFTPRGLGSATPVGPQDGDNSVFNPASIREFTPNFDINSTTATNGAAQDSGISYDPFTMPAVNQGLTTPQFNPYAEDPALGGHGPGYFQAQNAFATPLQPLQHHLYFPVAPHRDDLMPYHRVPHDFFLPEKEREEIARKLEAAGQVLPNSQLPQLDNYHNLVPLDTTHRKNANIFGYPSWVYKATATKTGNLYCLRRLEGYRLTNEHAIRLVKEWRRINNGNVVTIIDAFTTRAFGDSSLIFVQDYYPLSKTLVEAHLTPSTTHGNRFQAKTPIAENVLWAYISQIANALQAIHSINLAARCIDPSKIILTHKNRIRLSACSILDVVQYDAHRPIQELQQEDFIQFGRLLLCLTTNTLPVHLTNYQMSVEQMSRVYSVEMRDTVLWLLTPQQPPAQKGIEEFVRGIAGRITTTFDQNLQALDKVNADMMREIENGRAARLMMKLATINERPEFEGDRAWSENGERYMLKLFRDYVFHQVDNNGKPVLDMGHMLRCMNKLDIGSDERICLTSRDEQTSFLVSFKELKKMLTNAFGELVKGSKSGRGL
ncbi:PAB-dependent poly(A)-specific ribonuclease subunit 3 [Fusarium irregulare]|uniref:PAN2-PAN3 deadenylation complex subunit PAN3 n=1 Tax=Fusarium irregulare TaxID=2494466 RepID=A0A9W8PWJ3_9HYPO|nr:PAB-dependent poly(A)-specific ribonuclease subunit 3 [Fusarium irregulare]KAJ4026950.1 PAB-dependent poly(A)-specific ribonuclease subunit 3 [Fusarium irregulare]